MSKYSIKYSSVKNRAATLKRFSDTLASYNGRIAAVESGMETRDSSMAALRASVQRRRNSIAQIASRAAKVSPAVESIVQLYEKADDDASVAFGNVTSAAPGTGSSGSSGADKEKEWTLEKWLWEAIGGAGPVGAEVAFFKALYDLITGGGGNVGKPASEAVKALWDLGTNVFEFLGESGGSAKAEWAKLFGLDLIKLTDTTVAHQLKDFVGGAAEHPVGTAVAKWGTVLLTGAVNFFDNFEEFGGVTGRGIGETVIETVVDVGLSIGMTALVGAGLAALGVVSAPAVLVAAASAALVYGANAFVESKTGIDIGEHVADFVFDKLPEFGNWLGEQIGNGVKVLGDVASNTVKEVVNMANDVKDSVGKFATSVSDTVSNVVNDAVTGLGNAALNAMTAAKDTVGAATSWLPKLGLW